MKTFKCPTIPAFERVFLQLNFLLFTYVAYEITDERKLQEIFKEKYPDCKSKGEVVLWYIISQGVSISELPFKKYNLLSDQQNIIWKDLHNLNPRTHKQLCDDVLKDIIPPDHHYNNYSYFIELQENLEEERIIYDAPLKLQNETVEVTIVQCHYKEITFYVTRADDEHMFTVVREPKKRIFHLRAGLHPVQPNYTVKLIFTTCKPPKEEDWEKSF